MQTGVFSLNCLAVTQPPPQALGFTAALQQGVVVCMFLIGFLPECRFASLGLLQTPATFQVGFSLCIGLLRLSATKKP